MGVGQLVYLLPGAHYGEVSFACRGGQGQGLGLRVMVGGLVSPKDFCPLAPGGAIRGGKLCLSWGLGVGVGLALGFGVSVGDWVRIVGSSASPAAGVDNRVGG